jgi:type IV pilus assembly protein PilY1
VVTSSCTQTSDVSCQQNDLLNVSSATVCVVCSGGTTQVTGVTGATTLATLQGLVQSKDGWWTTLPTAGERNLGSPVVLAGIVFFPSFVPDTNICTASGTGYLYALFYQTGSAYKESVVGTATSGSNTNVKRSTSLGAGLQSQMAVHMGAGGSDTAGTAGGGGCQGGVTVYSQSSTGSLNKLCSKTAFSYYSRYVSWMNQRL